MTLNITSNSSHDLPRRLIISIQKRPSKEEITRNHAELGIYEDTKTTRVRVLVLKGAAMEEHEVLRIPGWEADHELNKNRKSQEFIRIPTKQWGKSYRRIVDRPDGAEVLGVWMAVLEVAAKCHSQNVPRGTLYSDGRALTASDIADITGLRIEIIESALKVLLSEAIGWLEYGGQGGYPYLPTDCPEFVKFWEVYPRKICKREAYDMWQRAVASVSRGRKIRLSDAKKFILGAAKVFATHSRKTETAFIPHPKTWLNKGRFDDDYKSNGDGGTAHDYQQEFQSERVEGFPEDWGDADPFH